MRKIVNLGTIYMNSYLVEIKDGWVLVDTGYPFDYKRFIKAAKRNRIEFSDVRYVVLTHVHADHAGFLKKILKDTGATLVCLPAEKDRLSSGANEKNVYISRKILYIFNKISALLPCFQTFEPVDIAEAIDAKTQPLSEEGFTFFVLHGHTDNDLCFQIDDKLFVGDVCMNGAGAKGYAPLWIEDNEQLVESWKQLISMDAEYIYVSHGAPFLKRDLVNYIDKQSRRKLVKLFK